MSSKSKLGWILLSGASIAAIGGLTPAYAQDDTSASAPTEEIVVTATGRSAAVQDVPLAVTAIPAQQIQNTGANDLRDLTQLAPSFDMGTGQSNTSGTIARVRGIGTGSDNPGFEGAVGIFIDGVYRARAGAALADLPDLVRVEVLRGPQGTLFGRNTSSGAISVVTEGPEADPGMSIEGTYGFDDLHQGGLRAMVNMPVSDSLAFRVDGSIRQRDGYIHDLISGRDLNDTDVWTGRAQALWDITPNATLRVIFDSSRSDDECCGITPLIYGSTHGAINAIVTGGAITDPNTVTIATPAINPDDRNMTITPGRGYGESSFENGVSAQLDWDLGFANLTSITSNRRWRSDRDQDIDFNFLDIAYRDGLKVGFNNFTQELRLQGEAGRLNWLVGGFYGDEDLLQTDTIRVGAQSSLYTDVATMGGTAGTFGGSGCELYNFHASLVPSIFQCAVGLLPAAVRPAMLTAINTVNGGYLIPNTTGQGQQADNWTVNTKNWSVFTHDEFNITDSLVLTVGARYNHEKKELDADLDATGNSCASLQAMETATSGIIGPNGIVNFLDTVANGAFSSLMNFACNPAVNTISNGTYSGDASEGEWTGTASIAYHINPNLMFYGGYSRGYKAGGYNVDRSGFTVLPETTSAASLNIDQLHFDPEFTDSYEVGMKSSPFGRGSTFNITGFYEQIHDYQLNAFNGFNFITRNVPDAISQGVELEASVHPAAGLMLTGGLTWNDAHYDSTVRFSPLTASLGASDPNAVFSGEVLSFAPKWVATGGVSYEVPMGEMHALFYLDARWNSAYRTQTLGRDPLGRTDNDAYAIFNGRVALGPNTDHWSVELWVRNLTNQFYYVGAFQPPLQNDYVVFPSEPRTYGITLRARY
jgi:outer membrane receptor protein involved in Fe transport